MKGNNTEEGEQAPKMTKNPMKIPPDRSTCDLGREMASPVFTNR